MFGLFSKVLPWVFALGWVLNLSAPLTQAQYFVNETQLQAAAAAMPVINEWEEILSPLEARKIDLGKKIWDIIWDATNDLRLYKYSGEQFSLELKISRDVFDNRDGKNTWTVMDRFNIKGSIPILNGVNATVPLGYGFYAGFFLGAEYGLEFQDIRQTSPAGFRDFLPLDQLRAGIQNEKWYREFVRGKVDKVTDDETQEEMILVPSLADGPKTVDVKPSKSPWPDDPENNARWSDWLNLLTFPFRLPLKADAINKMANGEVMGYVGQGVVQFGPSVGWELDPTGIVGLIKVGISYTTFMRGAFSVNVLKEDNQFVRVKVTRESSKADLLKIGGQVPVNVFDGFVLVRNFSYDLKIVPFSFETGRENSKAFDVSYRYNITNAKAREAYEQAMIGKLALSDELSVDAKGKPRNPAETGVEKLMTIKTDKARVIENRSLKLAIFYSRNNDNSLTDVDVKVTTANGTHTTFTAVAAADRKWKSLINTYEKMKFTYTVSMDLDEIARDPASPYAFTLIAEGKIEDSKTTPKEMLSYILQSEDSVGKYGIYPRPPQMMEALDAPVPEPVPGVTPVPVKTLGRTSFYYRVAFKHGDVKRFIETPAEQMWPALETAFGVKAGSWSSKTARAAYRATHLFFEIINVPLFIADLETRQGSILGHAQTVFDRWSKLKEIKDHRKRAAALGALFYDNKFSYELMRLLRVVLNGETTDYIVNGYSDLFGQIRMRGQTQVSSEDVASKIDQDGKPGREAAPSHIDGLSVKALDANQYEVSFNLQAPAKNVFVELFNDKFRLFEPKQKQVTGIAINNQEAKLFAPGMNRIVLDRKDTKSPWYELGQYLKAGDKFVFRISVNSDELYWGKPEIVEFKVEKK